MMPPRRGPASAGAKRAWAVAAGLALVSGCAGVPHDGPAQHITQPQELGLTDTHSDANNALAPDWWRAIGDSQLNAIEADALAHSPTLADVAVRLQLASAAMALTSAARAPQISADTSLQRQRFSANSIYPPPFGGADYWVGNAEVDMRWSLDLAGKQKAMIEAARAGARGVALDGAAARVTLAGAIAQSYTHFARAEAKLKVADAAVRLREGQLALTTRRAQAGLASELDIAAAQTLLAQARQTSLRAQGQSALMRHALAALAGRGPDYGAALATPSLDLASALPVPATIPADLLARRADIAAKRAMIEANMAGIRAARADFYPNVDLAGFIGASALGIGRLFSVDAVDGGVGPAVHLPIFSGGALKARYRASVSFTDHAITDYNAAVVKAAQEAADTLSQAATASKDAAQQRQIIAGLDQTIALDRQRMASGLASRLDLFAPDERVLAARSEAIDIDADGLVARIRLAVALGGGFAPTPALANTGQNP